MITKLTDYSTLFTNIATAVRQKTGSNELFYPSELADAINQIPLNSGLQPGWNRRGFVLQTNLDNNLTEQEMEEICNSKGGSTTPLNYLTIVIDKPMKESACQLIRKALEIWEGKLLPGGYDYPTLNIILKVPLNEAFDIDPRFNLPILQYNKSMDGYTEYYGFNYINIYNTNIMEWNSVFQTALDYQERLGLRFSKKGTPQLDFYFSCSLYDRDEEYNLFRHSGWGKNDVPRGESDSSSSSSGLLDDNEANGYGG